MRNWSFHAVLLQRDGGNREVPPGGWAAPEDHERALRALIRAAWPDREPTWLAFLEGGAVLRITGMPATGSPGLRATPSPTGATVGGTRHRRSPSPHTSDDAGDGRAPSAEAMGARGWEGDSAAVRTPQRSRAPRSTPPHRTARRTGARRLQWEGGRGQRALGEAHCPAAR